MKEHEVKLLLATVFFVAATTLISGTSKEVGLLIIVANLLSYILLMLNRILNELKKREETK